MTGFEPFAPDRLRGWLAAAGVGGVGDGPVSLAPIGDGLSNLTYAATVGDRTVVVRRPPPPPLPRGANDMRREARVLAALAGTAVPVPRVLAVAEAGEVAEAACYAMELVDGVIAADGLPPALDDEAGCRAVADAVVDGLAALHLVDRDAVGLGDFGRPDGFLRRRLERLPRLVAVDDDGTLPPAFAALRERLATDLPVSDAVSVLHGDYRFGNLLLARDAPARLAGVLDWELAAVGDPLVDLGYTTATYAVPGEPAHALTALSTVTLAPGFPSREELAARYARATGADLGRLPWYEALALFGVAVLFEYNRRRTAAGEAPEHYADPALVAGLLDATEATLARDPGGRL